MTIKEEKAAAWDGCLFTLSKENISEGREWIIKNDERHAVCIHLGGSMSSLETELDGVGSSFGPANVGEAWIIPSGTHHEARAYGGNIEYAMFFLEPGVISNLISRDIDFSKIAPLHGSRDMFCYSAARKLAETIDRDDDVSLMFADTIRRALSLHLFQRYGQNSQQVQVTRKSALDKRSIEMLRVYIYTNMAEKLTLSTLAQLAGMSTNKFLIAFRRAFGTTPGQYIVEQRMRRVQWLLTNSKSDITMIALETGFASHSHLSTAFKKHFGKTPSDYRADWR